jgi:hypothetical protein
MALKKKRRKTTSDAHVHVRLHRWMMKSAAWQSLPPGPRTLLVELYNLYDGSNNGDIWLSERDAAASLHASQNTVSTWFDMLVDRGFIKVAQRGAFSLKKRHATTWILTEFAVGNDLPSKEFARWRPAEDGAKPKSRRGGYRHGQRKKTKGEIQNPASNIEANSLKHCGNSADLSPPKQASQPQTLRPSAPIGSPDGVKDCCTGNIPSGADSSNHSLSEKTSSEIPSSTQPSEIGAADAARKEVSRRWGEQMEAALAEAQLTGDYSKHEELMRDHAAYIASMAAEQSQERR